MEKNIISLNEKKLKQIIGESIKKVLIENFSQDNIGNEEAYEELKVSIMSLLEVYILNNDGIHYEENEIEQYTNDILEILDLIKTKNINIDINQCFNDAISTSKSVHNMELSKAIKYVSNILKNKR